MRRKKITEVMGIVNVTPDSFSDGGQFNTLDSALYQAERLVKEGADWLDIGGESTRPGAPAVSESEELDRVIPVLEALKARFAVALSVDTSKVGVMSAAIEAGVDMINDVCALQQPGALQAVAKAPVKLCLMHMKGSPRTMQNHPDYVDVVCEVKDFLQARVEQCKMAGIDTGRIVLDPGFGFGKSVLHNYQLLQRLPAMRELGFPLLVGLSRKSMLGAVTGRDVTERLAASVAGATVAAMKGAQIIRVHDVKATVDAMQVVNATLTGEV